MFSTYKATAVAAAVFLAAPSLASAGSISFDNTAAGLYGADDLSLTFKHSLDPNGLTLGAMFITSDADDNFVAFSTQTDGALDVTSSYDDETQTVTRVQQGRLARLFNGYIDEIDTAIEAAAFQIAIYEALDDRNLDTGSFTFAEGNNRTRNAVTAQAQAYLTNWGRFDKVRDNLTFFAAADSQDLVGSGLPQAQAPSAISAVPLPASGLLLLAGLGALSLRGRKKS